MKFFWGSLVCFAAALAVQFAAFSPAVFMGTAVFVIAGSALAYGAVRGGTLGAPPPVTRGQFDGVLLALQDGLVVYDTNLRVLFWNAAAERIFNLSAREVVGHTLSPKDVEQPAWRLLAQVAFPSFAPVIINRSEPGEVPQVVDLAFDDPELHLRVSTSSFLDEQGRPVGFVKIINDRTREVELSRSKSEFVGIASHQLRTPITGINWALDMIAKDASVPEGPRSVAEQTLREGKELLGLVDDLLNITKIEEGRFGYQFAPASIVDVVNKILGTASPIAQQAGINLYFDPPQGESPQVTIDEAKLSMALQNLVDNALRYNAKSGDVTVKVEALADRPFVKVSVRDTGIGIAPEDAPKIFKKFFRAPNAMKSQADGSGLGLYVARNIIRAHGGDIGFESELNRGSTFYFTLPTDPGLVPQKEIPLEY